MDIEQLKGTGPGGRVVEADIRAYLKERAAPASPPPPAVHLPSAPAGDHWQELTPIQRITGERTRESVVNAPQFALELSADATNLLWLRDALDARFTLEARARLSLTSLLVKLVAATLREHPRANAELVQNKLLLHDEVNIGVAVGAENGLYVPVVKAADHKNLPTIVAEVAAFQEKAQKGHFKAEDLAGGTFTISNLGMFGIERFAAIVNPPQSAILAVGAVIKIPVVLPNDVVGVQPRMNLTLTVDHRVMDGVQGARFLAALKEKIEKPYFLIDGRSQHATRT
ncbi:MAG: 2-oxo acid dehydrogenase subunit E2 [Anaerolineales bacterium]|nr:2-oxo acid dehydrogenase subunit E2 [Anaerolineales bacterium]